jgi:hypothetical protein
VTVVLRLLKLVFEFLDPLLEQCALLLKLPLDLAFAHHLPLLRLQLTFSPLQLTSQLLTYLVRFLEIQFTLVLQLGELALQIADITEQTFLLSLGLALNQLKLYLEFLNAFESLILLL